LRIVTTLFLSLLLILSGVNFAESAGPWKAQIVDSETHQPLEGVVVVAIWERRAHGHPAIGLGRTGYYTHVEIATDSEGRFVIPARIFFNPPPFFPIEGPQLLIFKGGYGLWRVQQSRDDLTSAEGAVIEMRPLSNIYERREYMQGRWKETDPQRPWSWGTRMGPENPHDIPYQQIQLYEAAINYERVLLGLPPVGLGHPYVAEE
jgi:hypothetical protein